MPTEATPDRHTEVAANRMAEAAERTKGPPFAPRWPLSAPRPAPTAAPSSPPTGRCSPPSAPMPPGSRTGLMSLAAGVGAKTTLGGVLPEWVVVLTGSVLVAFAAFCFAAAVWRELYPGTPPPRPDVRRLPRALLFALNGFLALVALAALLGVWFGRTGGS